MTILSIQRKRQNFKQTNSMLRLFAGAFFGLGAAAVATFTPVQTADAATFVMDFTGVPVTAPFNTPATFSQNGITMDSTTGHFDFYGALVGGTTTDPVAAVHNGNGGEGVSFSYVGGAFDLLSVDVTGFLIRGAANSDFLTGTFSSNLGGTHTVTGDINNASAGVGVIDFSTLGAQGLGISSFTLTVPLGVASCTATCDILGFDDVTIADPTVVPVPAALPLFLSGLLGLGVMARRRRKQSAV